VQISEASSAALHGAITLKDGRVEQGNFDSYQPMRIDEVPVIETHLVKSTDLRRHRQARPHLADGHRPVEVRSRTGAWPIRMNCAVRLAVAVPTPDP
jgi:hypothetical protein